MATDGVTVMRSRRIGPPGRDDGLIAHGLSLVGGGLAV